MQAKWNLSEYENPKRYDVENTSLSDFPLLLSWSKKLGIQNEWILDIACGTGRVTIPLAEDRNILRNSSNNGEYKVYTFNMNS